MRQKQKLSGPQEKAIAEMHKPVPDFLTGMLQRWRTFRGEAWLKNTGQLPGQGKNLWSLPVFSHVAGLSVGAPVWLRGHAHFNAKRWTWFETDPQGPDRMLIHCDVRSLSDLAFRAIGAIADGKPVR